jgi:hypothetical protein
MSLNTALSVGYLRNFLPYQHERDKEHFSAAARRAGIPP